MSGAERGGGPLAGMTVVVTRPEEGAEELVAGIENLGGEALACPTIRVELVDREGLTRVVGDLARFDWIVFTSANAVRSCASLLEQARFSGKMAVVGSATAVALRRVGYHEHVTPPEATGASLAAMLGKMIVAGERVLLPHSDIVDRGLGATLTDAGVDVCAVVSYRTRLGTRADAAPLIARLHERIPDAVLFASPSAVRGLQAMLTAGELEKLMRKAEIVSIGPTTSAQVAALGFEVAREARPHTNEGMLAALAALGEGRRA